MSRPHLRKGPAAPPRVPADPALLEADLREWAGPRMAAAGRKDALLGRVELLCVGLDGRSIEARVRGNRPLPYRVQVSLREAALEAHCTCSESTAACRHAVAALEALRFPLRAPRGADPRRRPAVSRRGRGRGRVVQRAPLAPGFVIFGDADRALTREERMSLARAEELAAIRQRARREKAEVRPVEGGVLPRFAVGGARAGAEHVVTVRAERARLASCTCADWAQGGLLTCRHVERVRGWLFRRKLALDGSVTAVWWQPRVWTDSAPQPLREIRAVLPLEEWPRSLRPFFDDEGWLRSPPEGRRGSRWAEEALATVGRVALRRGLRYDADPAIGLRIAEAAAEEEQRERLAVAGPAAPAWLELREGLGLTLHPYLEQGVLFLARSGRAFLADDMGLGKTAQAIAAARLLGDIAGVKEGGQTSSPSPGFKMLVVCPASLKHQWRREIDKVLGERATVVEGPRAARLAAYEGWRGGFLILNYELVLRDLDAVLRAKADVVLLDEAQRIKNWETKTARAVKRLDSPYAFVLTGTPLENRLPELHSLVEFLHPRAMGPRWQLVPYHAVTEPGGRIVAYEGLDQLRSRLRGFFLRRERRAVLDQLPPRTDNTFWTGMTPPQRRAYRRLASQLAALVAGKQPLRQQEMRLVLRALTGMRILCNSLAQFDWIHHAERVRDPAPPTPAELKALHAPKLEEFARVLEDLLDEFPGKVVVFSQWERMLRLAHFVVRELLDARDLRAELFHGGLTSQAREQVLQVFGADPEVRVLFTTDAGGLGLNLQHAASVVVNLDVPWNPAVLEQRVGRVHRIGQRESVQVLHFVTRGALEERVRQVLENKRALFDGLLVDRADRIDFDETARTTFVDRLKQLL